MIVAITGASGYLGRAVAAELVAAGHEVRSLQRRPSHVDGVTDILGSITDPEAVGRLVDGAEGVVHLAAKVSLAGDPAEFHEVNVEGTRALLDAAERAGVSRFVQVSSPSVAHAGMALAGVGAEPASPAHARGEYARTKAEGELIALDRDSPAMRVVAVRPHLVWGPGDTQLVGRIVDRARRGRLPLLDGGRALIDSTYIDNAATGIVAALHRADEAHGRAFVITNGEPRPVGELLAGICLAAGVTPPRWSVPSGLARAAGSLIERAWALRPGADEPPMTRFLAEQLSTAHWFDQRETRRALAWAPSVSIDEGLRRLAAHAAATA
ncbi:NAD-dependent epimerase/dehydratase family protein [Microbacterium sp. zg.Y625]|uniref:NAD-dependent epimerase/dehydratase family protein n=1 Tax=Microbacterium jiangjiandongii TaxID=3049071 RepID=UPI00214C3407|nr:MULTISPECIES: NAD-dependent epimerase/dehydratase family protein [unclassified Microbacterium]MCR2791657.1 NAD-dependent epimerase/dehydratase family protein [Microbacterium sp. zg.Y625]MCR2816629.1 NAD-dependent epimerase/dehydratase family protein [Microbacterium sp. zg.Y843]WIM24476.1 NAD-dependent epimerase/dehydratase family protein [Microbacterium sp. zg-Y625]